MSHSHQIFSAWTRTRNSGEETDFGQSRFGHPDLSNFGQSNFGQSNFGQSFFGHRVLAPANLGHCQFWPMPILAIVVFILARPILANANFGQCNFYFWIWCVSWWCPEWWAETIFGQSVFGHPYLTICGQIHFGPVHFWPIRFWPICVFCGFTICAARKGGGPEGWWGPDGWEAQNFALFFPLPLHFRSFCLSLCVFPWFFGGVFLIFDKRSDIFFFLHHDSYSSSPRS